MNDFIDIALLIVYVFIGWLVIHFFIRSMVFRYDFWTSVKRWFDRH